MNPDRRIDDLVCIIEHDRRIFFECLAEKETEASRLAEKVAEASHFSESLFRLAETLESRLAGTHGYEGELEILRAQLSGAGVSPDAVNSILRAAQATCSEVQRLQLALKACKESWSYRLGYTLLYPLRKLRALLQRD